MADSELLPFQAAIEAGCSLIMTAHVAYPQLDPSGLPATLSPVILKQILRDQLGFRGVCCSDSLLMAGVRERFESEGEMALAALTAGVDLLLDIKDPELVVNYLAECITQGTLTEARVNEAFERIQALKQRSFSKAENKNTLRPTTVAAAVAEDVAQGAIQVIKRPEAGPLPFDPQRPLVAIFLKPFASPLDPPEQPLADALRGKFGDVQYVELGPKADAAAFEEARKLALAGDQLLLAMIVKPAAWHAFGLLPAQKEFVQQVSRERQAVLACLGVPYAFDDYPDASVQICTYSDVPVSQRALAEFVRQPFQADTL
jgi:beta-N-acetylhexosaminidase